MDPKTKEAAAQVPEVLRTAGLHMRKMAADQAELLKRANDMEHELKAYKLARRMEQRGLSPELGFEEKVAMFQAADATKLAEISAGLEFAAGGFRLGTTAEPEEKTASSADPLSAFITSQQAYA